MKLVERDCRIVEWVLRCGCLSAALVQLAEFPLVHDAHCQQRLTFLKAERYVDELGGRKVNEPAYYFISAKAINGVKLLRARLGDDEVKRLMVRIHNPDHLIGINETRIRVVRTCRDFDYNLRLWLRSEDLSGYLNEYQLIPDGYFQILRESLGMSDPSSYFLEFERVIKDAKVLERKLKKYGELVYSGRYRELFGTDLAPRILFVFAPYLGQTTDKRVKQANKIAKELGVNIARFTGLDTIKSVSPYALLHEAIWYSPSQTDPQPLLPITAHDA
jgi:hypothetical protein